MNSITQKTLKTEMLKAEIGRIAAPEWWTMAPVGERRFLGGLARMMRSARRSKSPDVARAAVKWERALGCFIKVRLITEKQKAESRKLKCVMRGLLHPHQASIANQVLLQIRVEGALT